MKNLKEGVCVGVCDMIFQARIPGLVVKAASRLAVRNSTGKLWQHVPEIEVVDTVFAELNLNALV